MSPIFRHIDCKPPTRDLAYGNHGSCTMGILTRVRRFFWEHFVCVFCYHWPLPMVVAFAVLIGIGAVGDGYGVPELVFHEDPLKQTLNAIALLILVIESFFISFLLQTVIENKRDTAPTQTMCPSRLPLVYHGFMMVFCIVATVATIVLILHVAKGLSNSSKGFLDADKVPVDLAVYGDPTSKAPFVLGLLIALTVAASIIPLFARLVCVPVKYAYNALREPAEANEQRDWMFRIGSIVAALGISGFFGVAVFYRLHLTFGGTDLSDWARLAFAAVAALFLFHVIWRSPTGSVLTLKISISILALFLLVHKFIIDEPSNKWTWGERLGLAFACLVMGIFVIGAVAVWITAKLGRRIRDLINVPKATFDFQHSIVLTFTIAAECFFLVTAMIEDWFTPVLAGCFVVFVLLTVYGFLVVIFHRHIPLVIATAIVLLFFGAIPEYKYRFPGLPYDEEQLLDLKAENGNGKTFEFYPVHDDREKGRTETPLSTDRDGRGLLAASEIVGWHGEKPLVIIVVSGGGIRSAAWTLATLFRLEERLRAEGIDFPAHVRIITGASGGMLGASCYAVTLDGGPRPLPHLYKGQKESDKPRLLYDGLTADHLTPLMRQMAISDLPALLSPWPMKNDRGKELEESWHRHTQDILRVKFPELEKSEREGRIPSLVFSPMIVEDGRRLLISNLNLVSIASNRGNGLRDDCAEFPNKPYHFSEEALQLFWIKPEWRSKLALSTVVRMSATFPFFSPAVSLPTHPRRRIVDAGYYDNYGVSLASSWLLSNQNEEWIKNNAKKICIIQIRDDLVEGSRRLTDPLREESDQFMRILDEPIAPLQGLLNARISSSSFRNDGQLEIVSNHYCRVKRQNPKNIPQENMYFTTLTLEYPGKAALSWYLTRQQRDQIWEVAFHKLRTKADKNVEDRRLEAAMTRNDATIDALIRWWNADLKFDPPEKK